MDILLEKSLINCHAEGLDSLVLKEGPNMIRMFIARPEHTLWKNWGQKFSVAMHRHHCDVTLQPIVGEVYNVLNSNEDDAIPFAMGSYTYSSPIVKGGVGGFAPLDPAGVYMNLKKEQVKIPTFMSANILHSVYVPFAKVAAWYVWEGKENPNHNNTVYSNDDLANFDFSKMDQPMTEKRLKEDLEIIGVYSAR